MANTTFSGPIRSENGFQQVVKNATTGTVSQKEFQIQTVATAGINNIVDTNGFSGTATAAGANNASLDTGATIFGITPNAHGSGIPDASINTFVNKVGGTIVTSILIMAALTKKYVYLVQGTATNAAYLAGKIWIRITGMNVDFNNG